MNANWTRSVPKAAFEWAVYFGAWWLFVGSLSVPELVLGGLAATFALLAAHLAGAHLGARFWGSVRALVQAWRLPRLVASGTWDILQVLLKDVFTAHKAESLLRAVHFAHAGTSERDQTLQALATAYTTVSPNFVVIDVDPHAGVLLFHQLDPTPVPKMTISLGARP